MKRNYPYVYLCIYTEPFVFVYHLWRPVHQCCVLFKFFIQRVKLITACVHIVDGLTWWAAEITKFESLVMKENIFNFDVSVTDRSWNIFMHSLNSSKLKHIFSSFQGYLVISLSMKMIWFSDSFPLYLLSKSKSVPSSHSSQRTII